MDFVHVPVLLDECMNLLNISPDGIYVDGTAGGGGHSKAIANRLTSGRIISIDRDPDAIDVLKDRMKYYKASTVVQGNFCNIKSILNDLLIDKVDGILLDLGVSSYQLDNSTRGFSFHKDSYLDMRMSKEGLSAADLINDLPKEEIYRILKDYGEEDFAMSIADNIVKERVNSRIYTTGRLVDIIRKSVPAAVRRDGHPARKTFQALRIAVNSELDNLKSFLLDALSVLKENGRLVVITFHSLEDRIVKNTFADWAKGCTCPSDFPVCVCGKKPKIKIINKRGTVPSQEEINRNIRSRSSKVRCCEKL